MLDRADQILISGLERSPFGLAGQPRRVSLRGLLRDIDLVGVTL